MTHYDRRTLPFGDVMDLYSVTFDDVFFEIANHEESLSPLAPVIAI